MLHLSRPMLIRALLTMTGCALLLGGCDRDGGGAVDASILTANADGDLVYSGGEITSERYRRWLRGARALESIPDLPAVRGLRSGRISADDAERAIAALERHAGARRALSQVGLTVREYVYTTIALDRQMQVAGAGGRPIPPEIPTMIDTVSFAPLIDPSQPAMIEPYPVEQPPIRIPTEPYPPDSATPRTDLPPAAAPPGVIIPSQPAPSPTPLPAPAPTPIPPVQAAPIPAPEQRPPQQQPPEQPPSQVVPPPEQPRPQVIPPPDTGQESVAP